jgi:hypothetical protein
MPKPQGLLSQIPVVKRAKRQTVCKRPFAMLVVTRNSVPKLILGTLLGPVWLFLQRRAIVVGRDGESALVGAMMTSLVLSSPLGDAVIMALPCYRRFRRKRQDALDRLPNAGLASQT